MRTLAVFAWRFIIVTVLFEEQTKYGIWDFYSGVELNYGVLGCDTVQSGRRQIRPKVGSHLLDYTVW
jgi:hypothetical protein